MSNINQSAIDSFNATQEKVSKFWRFLGVDFQDFLELPSDIRLVTLTNNCQAYLNEVKNGHLTLPRVHRKPLD
jgi:hypothetical protein